MIRITCQTDQTSTELRYVMSTAINDVINTAVLAAYVGAVLSSWEGGNVEDSPEYLRAQVETLDRMIVWNVEHDGRLDLIREILTDAIVSFNKAKATGIDYFHTATEAAIERLLDL